MDDQTDVLTLVDETLSACGAEVRTHTAATTALADLRTWQSDVPFSDSAMPSHAGYGLIRAMRVLPAEADGPIPALPLTA